MSTTPIEDASPEFAKRSVAMLLVLCALTMTACVSNISSQVKESDKDQTRAFDGAWVANVQKSPGLQSLPGKWVINCNSSTWNFGMQVLEGVAKTRISRSEESAFVSPAGDFRFEIPIKNDAHSAPGASRDIALGRQTMIIYGNLKKAKGRFTIGIAEFGNNGCTAIIKFNKAGA